MTKSYVWQDANDPYTEKLPDLDYLHTSKKAAIADFNAYASLDLGWKAKLKLWRIDISEVKT